MKVNQLLRTSIQGPVHGAAKQYINRFDTAPQETARQEEDNASLSAEYYSLATDFYLHGWGRLFHFGVRKEGESHQESLLGYETYLADKLDLKEGEKCLDLGCGVGGPMINIIKHTNASITGINNLPYQLTKARQFALEEGVWQKCAFLECDWMDIPKPDAQFDKAYGIEATCHAANNRSQLFSEINRLLKPGGLFATYEWVMTDKYDPTNIEHRKIKKQIEIGDGISTLTGADSVRDALIQSGFEILECNDRAADCDARTPWYLPLKGEAFSLSHLRTSPIGRFLMHYMLRIAETLHIIPKGSTKVHSVLEMAADGLVAGGEKGIFTPMLFVLARKPRS